MQSRDFAFWLQGFFELAGSNNLTADQVKMIKTHLSLVFKHDAAMEHAPATYKDPIRTLRRPVEVKPPRQSFPRC